MKRNEPNFVRLAYAGMITVMTGMFVWLCRDFLPQSTPFFALGAAYAVVLYRVLCQSGRAFLAMQAGFFLIYLSLFSVEDILNAPAAGPWLLGIIAGGIAGSYVWLGPRAGGRFTRKRQRTDDGGFTGGWPLALVNAGSAAVLLGAGLAHLLFQSPTPLVAAVFAAAVGSGWALFRFATSVQARSMALYLLPLILIAVGLIGGASGLPALPMVLGYGILAGILLGGRYWAGPRFGEPRPPFTGQGGRRRRRRRRPRSRQQGQQASKRTGPARRTRPAAVGQ